MEKHWERSLFQHTPKQQNFKRNSKSNSDKKIFSSTLTPGKKDGQGNLSSILPSRTTYLSDKMVEIKFEHCIKVYLWNLMIYQLKHKAPILPLAPKIENQKINK